MFLPSYTCFWTMRVVVEVTNSVQSASDCGEMSVGSRRRTVLFIWTCLHIGTAMKGSHLDQQYSTGFWRAAPHQHANPKRGIQSTDSTEGQLTGLQRRSGRPRGLGCTEAAPATAEGGGRVAVCSSGAPGRGRPTDGQTRDQPIMTTRSSTFIVPRRARPLAPPLA